MFALEKDGSLGQMTDFIQHAGSGPNLGRQAGPHPHMVLFYPPEVTGQGPRGDVLVPDLGSDAVLTYSLSADGKLVEKEGLRFRTAPGAGPRHLRFHPNGRHLFVVNELDSTLMVLRLEGDSFVPLSTVPTLGPAPSPTARPRR